MPAFREYYTAINESKRIFQRRTTDRAPQQTLLIASDPTVPSAPSMTATAADQAIDLTITKPTTNTTGSAADDLQDGELTVYYSTSPGIDVGNAGTYSGTLSISITNKTTEVRKTFATSAQHYFVATCTDSWQNTSAASAEVEATPTTASGVVSVDDYANNIANIYVGAGMIGIEFQPPKTSWERWSGWKLYAEDDGGLGSLPGSPSWELIYTGSGGSFLHKGLNESYLYEYKLVVVGEDGTVTSGTVDDNSGAGYQPDGADNSSLLATTVFAEKMVATKELYGQNIIVGASGALRSGQTAYNTGTGWWLGDASSTPKLSIGNPAGKWLKFDGTDISWDCGNTSLDTSGNLTAASASISGAITASSGSIGGFTIGASSLTAGTGGTAVGIAPATYPFYAGSETAASAPFRVTSAGALVATSATISGTITIGAGSSYAGNTIGTSYTAAKCTDPNADQTSANTANDVAYVSGIPASTVGGWSYGGTTYIDGGDIYTGTVTANKITATYLSSIQSNTGTLTINAAGYIQSSNYSAGTAGFKIEGDGDAEFNDVTVRGALIAGSGSSIGASYLTAGTITGSKIQTASSGTRITMETGSGPLGGGPELNFYTSTNVLTHIRSGRIHIYDTSGTDVRVLAAATGRPLELDQDSTTAATEVLYLNQADVDEPFIYFDGGANAGSVSSFTNCAGSIYINVNGTVRKIPYWST